MSQRIFGRHISIAGLLVGLAFSVSAASAFRIAAAPGDAPVSGRPAGVNLLSHAHGCEKMYTSSGSLQVFQNGIKNVSTSYPLQLACALNSPVGGFDITRDFAGADVYDTAIDDSVVAKACWTSRAVFGTGCGPTASTPKTGTGLFGLEVELIASPVDSLAVRYIDVTLHKQPAGGAGSVLRAFGYYDYSVAQGGGGGGGGDLTALQASVAQHTSDIQAINSAIAAINTTLTNHTNAIAALNSTVSGGSADLTALETEVSGNTTAISSLNTTVGGHTSSIASINGTLSTHSGQIATLQTDVLSLQGNMSSTQSNVSLLQGNMSSTQSNVSSLQSDMSFTQSNVSSLQSEMTTVDSNVSALWSNVNTHTDQLAGTTTSSLKSNIDGLWSSVNTHTDQFAGTTTSSLKASIDALWSDSSTQSTQISSLNSTVSSQGVSLTRHHKRLSALEVFSFYRVFVTSTTYNGNMGGVAGADANCQARATAGGLSGSWKAWVSGSTGAYARMTLATAVRYINLYGDPVAIGMADFVDGSLAHAIMYDEFEVDRSGSQAWTGTTPAGTTAAANCSNWTVTGSTGVVGAVGPLDGTWTQAATPQSCATMQRLYCIEQGT